MGIKRSVVKVYNIKKYFGFIPTSVKPKIVSNKYLAEFVFFSLGNCTYGYMRIEIENFQINDKNEIGSEKLIWSFISRVGLSSDLWRYMQVKGFVSLVSCLRVNDSYVIIRCQIAIIGANKVYCEHAKYLLPNLLVLS